jgi:serine/threonine protein kinase
MIPDKKLKVFCGTPNYMAPEIVMKKEHDGP